MKRKLKRFGCETDDVGQAYLQICDLHERLEEQYIDKLAEAAPNSLSCFIEYMTPDEPPPRHVDYFCEHLEAIERRDIMRSATSVSTGYAKSKAFSQMFPAWYLGRNPLHRYIQGGHSQAFVENNCGKVVRDHIDDPRYRRIFPNVTLHPRSTAAGNWKLDNRRGGYVCKGVGQKIAGYRGHIGGLDDLIGSWEEAESKGQRDAIWKWLWGDFRRRLLPQSPMFIIMTRYNNDDPIARIEEMNRKKSGYPWEIINLNVIIETEEEMATDPLGRDMGEVLWPDYYTREHILEVKATSDPKEWWAFDKGKPRNMEGSLVHGDWIKRYKSLPANEIDASGRVVKRHIKRITVSVDCAKKATERSNWTVASVWIEDMQGRHYLAEVYRKKVEFNDMIALIENAASRWHATTILVEDEGNGTAYIQQRRGKAPAPIIAIPPKAEGSKWNRFDRASHMFEAGEVYLPEDAPWLTVYEDEILAFPLTNIDDDQVDSTSQYLLWCRKRGKYGSRNLRGAGHA